MLVGWLFAASFLFGAQAPVGVPHTPRRDSGEDQSTGRAPGHQLQALRRLTLRGTLLRPDGLPAEDALVTATPGGETRTRIDGTFELELRVPRLTEALFLRARSEGNWPGALSRQVTLAPALDVLEQILTGDALHTGSLVIIATELLF